MSSPAPTPTVPLARLQQPGEIILRAGDAQATDARQRMQDAYVRRDATYPDAVDLSVLFRLGATLDELAREGQYPHAKLCHASTIQIVTSLAAVGYVPVLFVTPTPDLPEVLNRLYLMWLRMPCYGYSLYRIISIESGVHGRG